MTHERVKVAVTEICEKSSSTLQIVRFLRMLAVEDVAFLPLESALFRPAGEMDVAAEARRCRWRDGFADPYAAENGRQDHSLSLSLSLSDDDLGAERFPKLKGSIGEGSNHSNFSHQSSVKFCQNSMHFARKFKKFRI